MKFVYTGIRVRNLERSLAFYTKTMGMKEIKRGKMHAGGIYVQLIDKDSAQELELNYYPPRTKHYEDYVEGSELDHLAFWSTNVRRDYKRAIKGGATPAIAPWDESGYTLAFIRDPDGCWIELIGRKIRRRLRKPKQKKS